MGLLTSEDPRDRPPVSSLRLPGDGAPSVFFSYAKSDDADGRLSHIRERLEGELRAVSGRRLKIFQDRVDVRWGEGWRSALEHALDTVSVLVAIVTPSYLASAECQREITAFRSREGRLGRADLILPLYYIDCEELEDPAKDAADATGVIALLRARQRFDGRFLRELPVQMSDRESWRFINLAARHLSKAIERASEARQEEEQEVPLDARADGRTVSIPEEDFGLYRVTEPDGRLRQCDTLVRSIVDGESRFVVVHGAAGIGKTTLVMSAVRQLIERATPAFDFVVCRSLRRPPALEDLLGDLISFVSSQQDATPAIDPTTLIEKLRELLRKRRCLLVLDNLESLFASGEISGVYRKEFKGYRTFLQTLSTLQQGGCVVVTSREMPRDFQPLVAMKRVLSFAVRGIDVGDGERILRRGGIDVASPENLDAVVTFYGGNPFALTLVAAHAREVFGGSLDRLMEEGGAAPLEYMQLLECEVGRLNELESDILNWIALESGPVSARQLHEDLVHHGTGMSVQDALSSLTAHHVIQRAGAAYEQTPVLAEFVTARLLRTIAAEIVDPNDAEKGHLRRYALVRAQAKSDVQVAQRQLVLGRLAEELDRQAGGPHLAKEALRSSLAILRKQALGHQAYGPGNILNLVLYGEGLPQFQWNLCDFDFSGLAIRQVDFGSQPIRGIDFSRSQFWRCRFFASFRLVPSMSFTSDGRNWASGDADGDVRIWRTEDGRELFHVRHGKCVRAVAFSPDGSRLATGGFDNTLKLWSIDADDSIALRHTFSHRDWVGGLAFSPDGSRIASASDDGTVRLWTVESGEQSAVLRGHRGPVSGVAFCPDAERPFIASCGKDCTIRLWDPVSAQPLMNAAGSPIVLQGHEDWVWSIAFSPDGRHLASASDDMTVRLWSTADWRCLATMTGHQHWVWSVAFSPDGRTIASGGRDSTVRLWDLDGGCRGTLRHRQPVWSVTFRPRSNWLATTAEDQTVQFWDSESTECIRTLQGHSSWNRSVAFNAVTGELVSAGDDRLVRIWYPPEGTTGPTGTIHGHTHWVRSVALSPDGQSLATASDDHTIGIWNVWSPEPRVERLKGHTARVNTVAFSPDGQQLASGSDDRTIRLWNIGSRQSIRVLKTHKLRVKGVAFDGSGGILASASHDKSVVLSDTISGRVRQRCRVGSRVEAVAISPEGQTVACGCDDHSIALWYLCEPSELHRLRRHGDSVRAVAFSPDGALLAAGGDDGLISIWDPATRDCLAEFSAEGAPRVAALAFRKGGSFLASAHQDHVIRVWNVVERKLWTELHCPRPYEGLRIGGAFGLSEAERRTLHLLGAIG